MIAHQDKTPTLQSVITCLGFLSLLICTATSQAEIVGDTHWMVRPGESTYSIARKLYPNDLKKREQFRIELMQANAAVFKDGPQNMKVGTQLKLPAMMQTKPATTTMPVAQKVVSKVTPDPEETIGRVIINMGTLEAENRGSVRTLKRNSEILKGDTLKTANNSQAQIRFKDGALVSLRSNTEFQIEEYAFNGQEDGSEKNIFNLIKGGFRTITGLIGHRNKQNYSVRTTVATIGIRGTHYGLMLCEAGSCANQGNDSLSDGLYGGVVDGSIITENESGISQFNNDQYFHIASAQTPPVEILLPPPVFNNNEQPQQLARDKQSDDKIPDEIARLKDGLRPDEAKPFLNPMTLMAFNDEARPLLPLRQLPDQNVNTFALPLPPKAPAGSGMALAFSHLDGTQRNGVGAPIIVTTLGPNNIFLERYTRSDSTIFYQPFAVYEESLDQDGTIQHHEGVRLRADGTGANIVDSSINGTINFGGVVWGRWNGDYLLREDGINLQHDQNLHFIYSPNLTTLATLNSLGGIRSRVEIYKTLNGTFPTDNLNQVATVLPDISVDVDFVNHQIMEYSVNANILGVDWYGSLVNPIGFNELNHSFLISGACHNSTCDGEASLLFVGTAAGGAMTSYSLVDLLGNSISGAALLTPITNTQAPDASGALYAFNDTINGIFTGQIITAPNRTDNLYLTTYNDGINNHAIPDIMIEPTALPSQATRNILFDSSNFVSNLVDFGYATSVTDRNSTAVNVTVNWGRWGASASEIMENGQMVNHNDVHFIHSPDLTPLNVLIDGTLGTLYGNVAINYSTVDGSLPTDHLGRTGSSPASVYMQVNFFTQEVTSFSLNASTGAVAPLTYSVDLANPVNFTNLGNGLPLTELATPSCGAGLVACTGIARLNFIGPQGEGAITSYVVGEPDGSSTITGTVLLSQGGT